MTDFVGEELQPVPRMGGDLAEHLTLRLDRTDREALARFARAKGLGPSTLARARLKERLRQESAASE